MKKFNAHNVSRHFTKKGNVAGFTEAGHPVVGQFHHKTKQWSVHSLPGAHDRRNFSAASEADSHADKLIHAETTKRLKWWGK